jgi:hypothetical protein
MWVKLRLICIATQSFAMAVAQIPWAIIETALFTLILYFFVGYYHGAGETA